LTDVCPFIIYILNDGTNVILGDFNFNVLSQNHHFSEFMSSFKSEFGLSNCQITRQRQTYYLKAGQRYKESCLDLVFVDDVGRVQEKHVVFCNESDQSAVIIKLKFNDKHKLYCKTI
jgi:hypothetical protein